MEKNESLQLAEQYVNQTRRNIFLTGKAGTGKTTFVNNLKSTTFKRFVVLAPTGVAAINAGGMTIHSFFQLPFGTLNTPEKQSELRVRKYNNRKRAIIRSLDLLIIDEISMVRADVMDAIDYILRKLRRNSRPFGGLQLLLIGDLFQLPPVVRNDEISILAQDYRTHYFFGSNALQHSNLVTIELTHIYRQQAGAFVDILNEVRNNRISKQSLDVLNAQYQKQFAKDVEAIILTSHRRTSQEINEKKLKDLSEESQFFKADIEGEFPQSMYPNEEKLELKVGARVMFIKNDRDEEKRYYNGKLGTLTVCDDSQESVTVLSDEGETILVLKEQWTNENVRIDSKSKELIKEIVGSYEQLPLRLAWAITIHKSQGLTFDHLEIDAQAAFAHGQVYVALSRCRSLEGIRLRSKISESAIRNDTTVVSYEQQYHQNQPTSSSFQEAKKDFERYLLMELFDYRTMEKAINEMLDLIKKIYKDAILPGVAELKSVADIFNKKIETAAQKFSSYIQFALASVENIESSPELVQRLQDAANYFYPILNNELWPVLATLSLEIDNKGLSDRVDQHLESIRWKVFSKAKVLNTMQSPYELSKILKAQAKAPLHYEDAINESLSQRKTSRGFKGVTIKKKSLYDMLKAWRSVVADNEGLATSKVLTVKAILEIVAELPTDGDSLAAIKGIGPKTMELYGDAMLDVIAAHRNQKDITIASKSKRSKKTDSSGLNDTTLDTLALWQEGKSKEEISEIRGFSSATISKHLSNCVEKGKLDINDFIGVKDRDLIASYFKGATDGSLGPAMQYFKEAYSYEDLRMVKSWTDREKT